MKRRLLHTGILVFILVNLTAQVISHTLSRDWKFRQKTSSDWHSASVPGNVFKDLQKAKLIEDPFYSDNEKKLQWIEREDWEYQCDFDCDSVTFSRKHIDLCFDGLDTYARVYLNDSLILSAENMFRFWQVDVKRNLKLKGNRLTVLFESAVKKGKQEAAALPYRLPEGERVFTRKAQFQYGWDFGPRFAGCGIWKPVHLRAWNGVRMESVHYELKHLADSLAEVNFIIETISDRSESFQCISAVLNDKGITIHPEKQPKQLALKAGKNTDTFTVFIRNPKRWWSNGLGESYLYQYSISIFKEQTKMDEQSLRFGLRTIELINENDSSGVSFYFKLNGKPIFMRGANYIPSDVFLTAQNKKDYSEEIENYKKHNINMLRVWGGGVYGDDDFYESCDEHGILVWQDFMFACAMYPGDQNFISNVRAEIQDQIIRLRNHPSLALWCGNNEIDEAWNNWGWQKQFAYSKQDSAKIWKDYQSLFHTLIPEIKKINNPVTPYWPSSPSVGWGRSESLKQGDSHYWGVWWGNQPFGIYRQKVGRFVSEYGFQAMPDMSTFKMISPSDQLYMNSTVVKAHQKHKTGYEIIQQYLEQEYKTPFGLRNYVYISQLVQRDGMKIAIEAHRTAKPYCMGTLFWQLNDCWPGTSWSAIDYFKQPKAFYYSLKNLYKTQLISVSSTADLLTVVCVSDSLINYNAILNLKLLNFKSEVIWQHETKVELNHSNSTTINMSRNKFPVFDTAACYLKAELISASKVLARSFYFFVKPKSLMLPKTSINIVKIDSNTLEVSSHFFAKDVYIYDENQGLKIEDNYFDLEAGEKKYLRIDQTKDKRNIPELKAISLNNL